MAHIEVTTEYLMNHVRGLERSAQALDRVTERVQRGLAFAKAQMELTEGFPGSQYWEGKAHGYQAVLEAIAGSQL